MDYEHLRDWRDICEHLNTCWYKFDDQAGISQKCPSINRKLIDFEGRELRATLWDRWLIQLIRWGDHPILYFRNSRATRREFKHERGWILVNGWEAKIDFLEKLVLFEVDEDTLPKPWQPLALARIQEREAQRIQRKGSALERLNIGLCPHCGAVQITLMMDCPTCGKCYEEF